MECLSRQDSSADKNEYCGLCGRFRSGRFDSCDDHGGADRCIADGIDQDERAHLAVFGVGVEEQRQACLELHLGNVVHVQLLGCSVLGGDDINAISNGAHGCADGPCRVLCKIGVTNTERLLVHPHDHGAEACADLRRFNLRDQHFTSA